MTTYNTGNPVPSTDARDRYDNSQTFDEVMNGSSFYYMNRTGSNILSMSGMAQFFYDAQADRAQKFEVMDAEFDTAQEWRQDAFNRLMISTQFEWPPIPFEEGSPLEVSRPSQLISREGQLYSVRLPANFPVVLSGVWDVAVVSLTPREDASVRQQLASASGATMSGWKRSAIAKAIENVAEAINTESVSVWECAHLATGYSIGGDMSTWDWAPAINAASALAQLTKAGAVQFTAHRFNVTTTVRRLDGVSFRGMGDLKGQTAKHEVYDVTTIANVTNSAVVMESQGLTSGPKNIIAHMRDMKVLGNPLTTIVLDLKGFWLSKFSEVFIGGGLTTVWVRSDFPNGFSCYYNSFRDSIISGMNLNNFDQITNVYGLRLTNDADEFFMDNVQILNASNAFSVESGSYCHIGYVNIEYSSVNHTPIYIDSVNSVIADLRCDPHRPTTRPFLHLGPNSGGNSIKLKTFESLRVTQVQGYYVKDEGRFNVVDAGQYGTDYQPGRNLVPNPDLVLTGTLRHGWVKSASVGISSAGVYRTQRVTKIELLAAETLGNANTLIDVPLDTLSLGDTVLLDCYIKVDSPSALVGFTDAGGFIPADGNISGQILSLPNSGGAFQRLRRAFVLTALPVGNLRLSIYPCRAAAGSVTPTIGDSVSISCLSVDIIDPWAASARNALAQDGTVPLLADLTNRMPAAGLVLTTPDGTKTFRLNIDNAGQIISTRVL